MNLNGLGAVVEDFLVWADESIPQATESPLIKLQEEAEELRENPSPGEGADVLMCLLYWAHMANVDLVKALRDKLEVNKADSWRQGPDMIWSRVK